MNNVTHEPQFAVADGMHILSFAYPTSDIARSHGAAATGCWPVQVGRVSTPFETREAALAYIATLETRPDQWSSDHPDFHDPLPPGAVYAWGPEP